MPSVSNITPLSPCGRGAGDEGAGVLLEPLSVLENCLRLLAIALALLLFAGATAAEPPGAAEKPVDIDAPDAWTAGRRQIARLGDGFLVWEARRDGHWSIWTIKLDGSGLKQLTPVANERDQLCPHIAPDGKTVAYLSLPHADSQGSGATQKGILHLVHADGTGDRVIVADARKYGGGWDRAVTWFTPTRLAYVGPDDNTYELDLAGGKSKLLVTGGGGWLPNTALTHVVAAFNTFSLLDAQAKTVTPMPHLGGCQPYFTHDGQWGFWMANMGGPIGKMRLSTREWSVFLDADAMPRQRDYCYFPNVSSSQCLLTFAAANHEKLRGGYGGYDLSDYNVFAVQIDPNTLEPLGKPVRYSFDSVCNRFPDAYQAPLALGFKSNKAPLSVEFTAPGGGQWEWDFGDGATARAAAARHVYAEPGLHVVSAAQGGKTLHGLVRVLPAKAPKALAAVLESDRTLLVTFDEAVNLQGVSLRLASGAAIEKWTASPDARSLRATLATKPTRADAILVENATDLAQQPNKMQPARLTFEPRLWPVFPEAVVFAWQTADKRNQVIDPASGKLTAHRFQANDDAKLDENYALRPDGGSFMAAGFAAQFGEAVRKSNAFSLEMTVTPEPAGHDRSRTLCSYYLSQRGDKLCYRAQPELELCTLAPGRATHVLITYTPGSLACYLDGDQVFFSEKITADLRGVRGDALLIGNDLDNQPWLGTVEGIAIFSRALSPGEARAEAEAYRKLRENRKPLAKVELTAVLAAASRPPTLAQIAPYRQGLVVNEYTVQKVLTGKLEAKKIRVAHWVILNGQTRDVAQLPLGEPVRLLLAPLAACPQLSGENFTDTLPEDFDVPVYYAMSAAWNHHAIPQWSAIGGFAPRPQDPNLEHGKFDPDPGYSEVFAPENRNGLPAGYTPAKDQQWKTAAPDAAGYVNLFEVRPARGGGAGCGYAVAHVRSPAARKAVLHAGTVGGFKAWLNGKQVLAGHFGRYPFLGHQDAPIELRAGWNELLVKSTQLYAFWGFTCDLLTPEGKLMTDLSYSAAKPQ